MKDEKTKYLMVNASDIHKQLYKVQRTLEFNDFYRIYTPDRIISIKEIFDKYCIPEEFQRIIISIETKFFTKYKVEEYITGFSFDIIRHKIEDYERYKYITFYYYDSYRGGVMYDDKFKYTVDCECVKYNNVMEFLLAVNDNGYLRLYLQAVKDSFNVSIDFERLYEIWEEEKDIRNTMKRYKKYK